MKFIPFTPPIEPLDIKKATEAILEDMEALRIAVYCMKHPKTISAFNKRLFTIREI